MALQQQEEPRKLEMLNIMEVPECPAHGKAYNVNEPDCLVCIDAEDCKRKMEEAVQSKPKPTTKKKASTKKKIEVKTEATQVQEAKKIKGKEAKPLQIKVLDKIEFKEIQARMLDFDREYEEPTAKIEKPKPVGMKACPLGGKAGKGNTTNYIGWLLYSGKWTLEQMAKKADYYSAKFGNRPLKKGSVDYIKGCIKWFKNNKGAKEVLTECKIKLVV